MQKAGRSWCATTVPLISGNTTRVLVGCPRTQRRVLRLPRQRRTPPFQPAEENRQIPPARRHPRRIARKVRPIPPAKRRQSARRRARIIMHQQPHPREKPPPRLQLQMHIRHRCKRADDEGEAWLSPTHTVHRIRSCSVSKASAVPLGMKPSDDAPPAWRHKFPLRV